MEGWIKFLEEKAPAKDALRREGLACDILMVRENMKFRAAENETSIFAKRFADREELFLDGCIIALSG